MEPPKPTEMEAAAARGLQAEFEEYQQLLSARFEHDPSSTADASLQREREARLAELGRLLFGDDGHGARKAP